MATSLATIAAYFRTGIIVGICVPDEAHAWALSVIATLNEQPGAIIEVSWHKPVNDLLADLAEVKGEVDGALVGSWLLARLSEMSASSGTEIGERLRQAMQVIRHTGLPDDLYYEFDALDDDLQLTLNGIFGDVAECRRELQALLGKFSKAPFDFR